LRKREGGQWTSRNLWIAARSSDG